MQFEDVHRLNDGQVKHSPEFFYAGSLWKVSKQAVTFLSITEMSDSGFHFFPIFYRLYFFTLQVSAQAFNDEDPQGRRTLGNLLPMNDEFNTFID